MYFCPSPRLPAAWAQQPQTCWAKQPHIWGVTVGWSLWRWQEFWGQCDQVCVPLVKVYLYFLKCTPSETYGKPWLTSGPLRRRRCFCDGFPWPGLSLTLNLCFCCKYLEKHPLPAQLAALLQAEKGFWGVPPAPCLPGTSLSSLCSPELRASTSRTLQDPALSKTKHLLEEIFNILSAFFIM